MNSLNHLIPHKTITLELFLTDQVSCVTTLIYKKHLILILELGHIIFMTRIGVCQLMYLLQTAHFPKTSNKTSMEFYNSLQTGIVPLDLNIASNCLKMLINKNQQKNNIYMYGPKSTIGQS